MTIQRVSAYQAVVIGTSAGGMEALVELLSPLPKAYPLPLAGVQHLGPEDQGQAAEWLDQQLAIQVVTAMDKMPFLPGRLHLAPANYHLLVEQDMSLSLSLEEKVCFCRPAIDLLFESAAWAFGPRLLALLLTGANQDGSAGLREVKAQGGSTLVQDPAEAYSSYMPQSAIDQGVADLVLTLEQMSRFLVNLALPLAPA